MTTGSRPAAFRVPVSFGGKEGLLLADQLRTADIRRLRAKAGEVEEGVLIAALAILREMFEP